MTDPNRLSILATRFIAESKAQWANIVCLAEELSLKQIEPAAKKLAIQTATGSHTIKRKFLAVKHAIETGLTVDKIIEQGQQATLASYVKGKVKARSAPLVAFPHRITPEVRAGLEELYQRIGRVVKCKTFDEATEFIIATFADLPDEELVHLAGEAHAQNGRTKR